MDNPLDQEETPNPVPHVHHYVLKGSGLSCYAECDLRIVPRTGLHATDEELRTFCTGPCGHTLAGDNGPIVGSRAKVEAAMP